MSTGALERLCRHLGIAPRYHDIWGTEHLTSDATRRALLAAMGHPVSDEAAAAATLDAIEDREWGRGLPPVWVVGEAAAGTALPFTVPVDLAQGVLRWRLESESGAVHEGDLLARSAKAGERRTLPDGEWVALEWALPLSPPLGYHRLVIAAPASPWRAESTVVVAPAHCYRPPTLAGDGRVWGLAAQLYAVRSARNWGIGDFTDLLRLVEFAADAGAGVVGVSPLHALFPHDPAHASPYSPSSRLFLNPLHLDLEAVPEFAECEAGRRAAADEEFQARLRALRAAELVRYEEVAVLKAEVLDELYAHFRAHHLVAGDARARAFRAFQRRGGAALHRHALFEALQAELYRQDRSAWGWRAWPEPYRDPDGEAVAEFESAHAEAIEAREYAQWQARVQLDRVGERATELGLAVGLYQDLAVGVDAGGAETWSDPRAFALGARVGAPPDDFNLAGQDWGLPPWRPEHLREHAYAPFIRTLRASMRAAGALRIDHVMGLARQFWIPEGAGAAEGTYVAYPLSDLLAVLALESHRNRCLIIGEDLGTVPDEVRRGLEAYDVLSYRLLYFSKDHEGAFLPPADYPARALVCASTHDLPTLAGFWSGADIELRRELELFPDPAGYEAQAIGRAQDRVRLLLALGREALLPGGREADPQAYPEMTAELASALLRFLARSPARLLAVQLEDLLGQREQVNLPGTTDSYPNWRHKLPLDIEAWSGEPRIEAMLSALREERGGAAAVPLPPETAGPPRRPRIPRATYRLQLDADTGFDRAAELVPYLDALGVSHAYCSPYLQARRGSTHGYDIRDHGALSAELGGREGFERFARALRAHAMSQIMDMVPNHMGVMGADNEWWLDVLENGPASRFAAYFDIDWSPLKDELRGKVLVPVLGDHYGNVLEAGALVLAMDDDAGTLSVHYFEHRFPLDPTTYPRVLGRHLDRLEASLGPEHPSLLELQSLLTGCANLPSRERTDPEAVAERSREKTIHQARLASLRAADPDVRGYVDECLREYNGSPDYPPDRALMHELLESQAYRLAYWRVAADQINYRRFFDINDLAALSMEREEVFEATHRLVFDLIARGRVGGLRIDHPDGLYDPAAYFRQVQARVAALAGTPGQDPGLPAIYLVAEKILAPDERLASDWSVHGTTGYEFAALAGGIFVDPRGADELEDAYAAFVGARARLGDIVHDARRLVMQVALSAELNVLAHELSRIAETDLHTRDFTESTLRTALAEVVACFPVYRTYIDAEGVSARDEAYVEQAVQAARRRARTVESTVFDFVREALLARTAEGKSEAARAEVRRFAMRVQQFTAPVAAKGVEDTAFYRYHRLDSLAEVGDDPGRFGVSVAELHRGLQERARQWPHGLLCTSTHDSKRSEDVRMRLHVLSEMPGEWARRVARWSELNRPHRAGSEGAPWPDPEAEYGLYQSLLGIWPLEGEPGTVAAELRPRLVRHVLKSAREAKVRTAWTSPDPAYEAALERFVETILDPERAGGFLEDFLAFHRRISRLGLFNSLGLTVLKLTAPGVPDIYQGNELWRFDLVDPDNRRAVDYEHRRALLAELERERERDGAAALAARLLAAPEDGRIKLYAIERALALRRSDPGLLQGAEYLGLEVHGARAAHVCAFARRSGDRIAVVVVPRLIAGLVDARRPAPLGDDVWGDTRVRLPARVTALRECFTDARWSADPGSSELPVGQALGRFPVAVLVSESGSSR